MVILIGQLKNIYIDSVVLVLQIEVGRTVLVKDP